MKDFLKVGISGVRGVVGDSFTPQVSATFAQAFGSLVGRGSVLVGRDTRRTGFMIEQAVVAGLQSVGCKPILTGVVPTPTLLILTAELQARGAVAITASHNAAQWNALKFVGRDGLFLRESRANQLFDLYHQGDFGYVPEDAIPRIGNIEDPVRSHFERIYRYVATDLIRRGRFRVAVDCCNGVGAVHTRKFLEALGCDVATCYDAPTGDFQREPEPLPENLGRLCELVRETGSVCGFAQDPDGDRLALVDENGQPLGEDLTVALAVQQVLGTHERGPVAVHLSTSRCVQFVAEQHGCRFIRTRIGEINVSQAMLENQSVVGGEGNGGVIVPAVHPCRDSYTAMALVLEMLATTGKTLSALRDEIPRYHMVKDKIRIQGERASEILRHLRRTFAHGRISLLDGVHVELGDRWVHVRVSNTEPVMRIVTEGPTRESALELAAEVKAQMLAVDG